MRPRVPLCSICNKYEVGPNDPCPKCWAFTPAEQPRKLNMKRYKKLLVALAAVATIYVAQATGLDQGVIESVFDATVEAVTEDDAEPANVGTPEEVPAERADAEVLDGGK